MRALLVAVALLALTTAAPAAQQGRHYVFRTLDTGNPPTAEQDAFCNSSFGLRSATVTSRLHAELYSFRVDPATGRLADQAASALGPGFICTAPGTGLLDAYAFAELPTTGRVDLEGPCGLRPMLVAPGALSVSCALSVSGSPAAADGLATSNSIVTRGPAALPTGSVWTTYAVGEALPAPPEQPPAPPPHENVEGLDFYVVREGASRSPASHPSCPPLAVPRVARLHAVQPDLVSGLVPLTDGAHVGELVLCEAAGVASAEIVLAGAGRIRAAGRCDEHPVAATGESVRRCALTVAPNGAVADGSATSNGVVGRPALWTVSLLAS